MKGARNILKIIAALAAIGAVAGLVITYWDKIMDLFYAVKDKIEEKRAYLCECDSEDFVDETVDL